MTIAKPRERKQVKRVFHDLSTLTQVWNSEPQRFQMVFSFWKLKFYEISNYKNASNRVGPNWVFQYIIGKVLKCKYWQWAHIFQLKLCVRKNCQLDSSSLKLKKHGLNAFQIEHITQHWKDFFKVTFFPLKVS